MTLYSVPRAKQVLASTFEGEPDLDQTGWGLGVNADALNGIDSLVAELRIAAGLPPVGAGLTVRRSSGRLELCGAGERGVVGVAYSARGRGEICVTGYRGESDVRPVISNLRPRIEWSTPHHRFVGRWDDGERRDALVVLAEIVVHCLQRARR